MWQGRAERVPDQLPPVAQSGLAEDVVFPTVAAELAAGTVASAGRGTVVRQATATAAARQAPSLRVNLLRVIMRECGHTPRLSAGPPPGHRADSPNWPGEIPHDVRDLVELTPLILAVPVTYRQVMDVTDPGRGARWDATWRMILRQEANVSAALSLLVLVIWVLSGGSFWPRWVWFGLAVPLALQVGVRRGLGAPRGQRLLTVHSAVTVVLALMMLAIWVLAGARGFFWPVWPALGLGIALAVHGWIRHGLPTDRERALIDRVEVLTRTRSGALDVQAAELRRIERDLHDGAQAKLIAVRLHLGLARGSRDPGEMVRRIEEAREVAGQALTDLRDLVRGIHPPVLSDRGLAGAIEASALLCPMPVEVDIDLPGRPQPPVESAVYFAVAEALVNVAKHSGASRAWVRLRHTAGVLRMTVGDNGCGMVRRDGGTGVRGIEDRLSAFDGSLTVTSPQGGPTVLTMEVPCTLS